MAAITLRAQLVWKAMELTGSGALFQQRRDKVRAASDRRAMTTRLPGAFLITGGTHKGAQAQARTAQLGDGTKIGMRVHRPRGREADSLPLIMNFHGGGFCAGDAFQSEWFASSVAAGANAVVVSPDYRLAPEHPYPAAPQDCYAATLWAVAHAELLGIDPARIAVMGDSAGANLAAVVALMARDQQGPAIAAQVLVYPVIDFVDHYPSEWENTTAPVLQKADIDNVPGLYFAVGEMNRRSEPYASPLRATTHDGLPPALIQTAQFDPLRDQGPAYAAVLQAAGVPVRLTNYPDAIHGFISMPTLVPCARPALREVTDFLAETVGRQTSVRRTAARG
jgi:acetyl esterase